MTTSRQIKKLDEAVINRIAAGEIIRRPSNALKELLENSLDAGATNIQILIKDGGLKLLQIQDNGHGIRKEDMAIVCERFTTSKIETFEDLSCISTYGFRGEALASITHVAHVTITTKTADSNCAYRAHYADSKLVPPKPGVSAEPKPCAGNTGTLITAEDLFYNAPTRREALKNTSEEYKRILDVVNRYAIYNAGQGSNIADVSTLANASTLDNIRQIYGSSTASELLELKKDVEGLDLKVKGYVSNANYNVKKIVFLLFINHRAVESLALKKTIESVYATFLPKGTHPFIYIGLEMKPQNIDVNVHTTKREVRFLYEDEIIAAIGDVIHERLAGADTSRSFLTQTLLPGASTFNDDVSEKENTKSHGKVLEYNLVRTDSRARTLDNFYTPQDTSRTSGKTQQNINSDSLVSQQSTNVIIDKKPSLGLKRKRDRIEVKLTSVLTLREKLIDKEHKGLTELFSDHTMVGCVDDSLTLALIQHQTKLYLVNYNALSEELFYQLILQEFANFGFIRLSNPASISELVLIALEEHESELEGLKSKDKIRKIITEQLVSMREMLLEYFSITITEDGQLVTLPLLLKNYVPKMDKLPSFLLRLGTEVNWEVEIECLETISRELGLFYAPEPPDSDEEEDHTDGNDSEPMDIMDESEDFVATSEQGKANNNTAEPIIAIKEKYQWQIEHLIFPALKFHFRAPRKLVDSGHVIHIASLPDLYKIFERS
ncbi:7645_t:CDS:10 [Paraglomus brasilianum]|uniref:7645_t:CDS:1 n=1 Tax=Paraglomus brasilianum TaxID=144538 RepID=A0A9N9F9J0_9GLOM|nr:7645_t:CDS:10 [Paraglomus brasilianum]